MAGKLKVCVLIMSNKSWMKNKHLTLIHEQIEKIIVPHMRYSTCIFE